MIRNFAIATMSVVLLSFVSAGCGKTDPIPQVVPVEDIVLDKTELQLFVGETFKLTASVLPENATNKSLSWSCDNPDVAAVLADGTVSGISAGNAVISVATSDGKLIKECLVTVMKVVRPTVLSGIFSTSADRKVQFSTGNLFYDGEEFHFEENQYDVPSNWSASHAGYFFWSKSTDVATGVSYSESGTTPSDIIFTNSGADTPNPDFVADGISGAFQTLSPSEWQYIFKNRPDASKLYRQGVNVCGSLNCIVLAPDDYQGAISEEYDKTAWDIAETSGLVCIPAAGYRDGDNVMNAGINGYYWSSSASYGGICTNITFDSTTLNLTNYAMRYIGYPLRIVSTVTTSSHAKQL